MTIRQNMILGAALLTAVAATPAAAVEPVVVNHMVSGSAGDYTYTFTFENHVDSAQRLYFFGILDPTGTVTGIPAGYQAWPGYTVGGTFYNLAWLDPKNVGILPGQQLGGFSIHDTAATVQSSFQFFGYTYADGVPYTGDQNVAGTPALNPAFTGFTNVVSGGVPEPATWAMMIIGFGLVNGAMRARKRKPVRLSFRAL